ncbi:MAG: universal stress protein, partial [Gemmatimonadota bacterium]
MTDEDRAGGGQPECPEPHTLLVAVDESDNSRRAVDYVARWVACYEAARVVLAHVVKEPSRDVLPDDDERERYLSQRRDGAARLLGRTRETLERAGIPDARIDSKTLSCSPPDTVVDALLEETRRGAYDT